MSYLVLARKWRPQSFADMVGQPHIARVLANAIQRGRIAHCYLFTGVRGVGKTSAARILAKSLNCTEGPTPTPCNECVRCREINEARSIDVYEIDGASNRGIDEVRQIIENVRYQPAAARFKVYIIDEVHQVTKDAFNALLKTLEEPPAFAKFILATTEVHRLPETILSRCQRFDFRRIGVRDIHERLRRIADAEALEITDGALTLLSRAAQGSMRDAQSLLEQVLSFVDPEGEGGAVDEPLLRDVLGVAERRVLHEISAAVIAGDPAGCLQRVAETAASGVDLAALSRDLVEHFRNLLVARLMEGKAGAESDAGEGSPRLMDLTREEVARLREQVADMDPETLMGYYRFMVQGDEAVSRSPYPRFDMEASLVRAATLPRTVNVVDAIEQLRRLERKLEEAGPLHGEGTDPGHGKPAPAAQGAEERPVRSEPRADDWDRFVNAVSGENPPFAAILKQGRVLELSAAGLKLGMEDRMHLDYLRGNGNAEVLKGLLGDFFQREMAVTVVPAAGEEQGAEAPPNPSGSEAPPAPEPEGPEDIVDEALRIFGGTVK